MFKLVKAIVSDATGQAQGAARDALSGGAITQRNRDDHQCRERRDAGQAAWWAAQDAARDAERKARGE